MSRTIRVLHIVSGDLWAGAEVQAFTVMSHLKDLPATEVAAVVMNPGRLADELHCAGVETWILEEQKNSTLRLFRQIRRVVRSWQPDVVHTHRQKENILGALANRFFGTAVCVRTVHGAEEHRGWGGFRSVRRRLMSAFDRWVGRTLQQRVIVVTREMGEKMASWFRPEMIAVIENGVDWEKAGRDPGVAEFRAVEPGATHIAVVGRLVDVKRVDLFLEAAALLRERRSQCEWRFHVIGEGPLKYTLVERARELGLQDVVTFHGHRDDVRTCLAGLDVLVICSDHEGMPMVALEAAALAVPTVAHAVGGLVEAVPLEFQVNRHDGLGYMDGILRALCADGRGIAVKHGTAIRPKFSARRNAERIRFLYEQVLAERHREQAETR